MFTNVHERPAHPGHLTPRSPQGRGYWSEVTNPSTTIPPNGPFQGPHQHQRAVTAPTQRPLLRLSPSSLQKPALNVISVNIEGFSSDKATLLANHFFKNNCDILCLQETHRDSIQQRPHIPGLTLIAELPHPKYGSAIFSRPDLNIVSVSSRTTNSIEVITVDTGYCTITSLYKPPSQPFQFHPTANFKDRDLKIIVGDFNSHSTTWGYRQTNSDGDAVEQWAEAENLSLLHDAKLPTSFNSCRWKRGYNPDLIFVSNKIISSCSKSILSPIPRTQHRPLKCQVHAVVKPTEVPFRRRFNFKKADWALYTEGIDSKLNDIEPTPNNYDKFVEIVWTVSRQYIPRGCRTQYIPGLEPDSVEQLKHYEQLYTNDPFSVETIECGELLMKNLSESRSAKWIQSISEIDMAHNSKKAWSTLRKLTDEPRPPTNPGLVKANQVAHQLLLNGKAPCRLPKVSKTSKAVDFTSELSQPFTLREVIKTVKELKNGKAAGIDELTVDQLKHLGPGAVTWLLSLFNSCLANTQIPKLWRKAKVIALLKPGKPASDPKNYRPISLLCHTYKMFEKLLLSRLTPVLEPQFIPEQAGFRPGKSCTGQVLRLTQHIENGYEDGKITGVVFVDLSTAYDTVNIKRLLSKVSSMTDDQRFVQILGEMLRNRSFQVHLNMEKSRWRRQKNGLPQGSVLAPILFNIYTNDQPKSFNTERFIYADDLALTSQTTTFEETEKNLTLALEELSKYYSDNALRPNPSKTQSCAFHLRNNQATRKLNIIWQNTPIGHCSSPTYLGVTLDRSLTYRDHCQKTKLKVGTRNNLLRRLTGTTWGATPHALRTTGLALCFSAGEYACPVWHRSAHAREVDAALNETCRTITGCLKPTPLQNLYPLAGIAPPAVRRAVACSIEKLKQEKDTRHSLFAATASKPRLKSRNSFLNHTEAISEHPKERRLRLWRELHPPSSGCIDPAEELPPGHDLPWATWKTLNRLRTQVGRCKANLSRWGYTELAHCHCNPDQEQTMSHLLVCPSNPSPCTMEDLCKATNEAVAVANYWAGYCI